jgi:hypothetical protein
MCRPRVVPEPSQSGRGAVRGSKDGDGVATSQGVLGVPVRFLILDLRRAPRHRAWKMLCARRGVLFSRPSVPSPYLPRGFGDFWAVPGAVPGPYRSRPRLVQARSERQRTGTGWQRPRASQASRSIMRGMVRLSHSRIVEGPRAERLGTRRAASQSVPSVQPRAIEEGKKKTEEAGQYWMVDSGWAAVTVIHDG